MNSIKHIKLLHIDHDEWYKTICRSELVKAGVEVSDASDGVVGLADTERLRPDVILLGITMPKMDGFTYLSLKSKNNKIAHIPVIVLSHMAEECGHKKAVDLGAETFVSKSKLNPSHLVQLINAVIKTRGGSVWA